MLGRQRLIVRRTRLVGAQAELWPDWRHHAFLTNRTDAIELVEESTASTPWWSSRSVTSKTRHSRTSPRPLPRERRLDCYRRLGAQPAQMDHSDRAARHGHPDRPNHPPPATDRPRPDHPHRAHSDTPTACPMAMGTHVPHSARPPPDAACTHLIAGGRSRETIDADPGLGMPAPARPQRRDGLNWPHPHQEATPRAKPAATPADYNADDRSGASYTNITIGTVDRG